MDIDLARHQWEDGSRKVERSKSDREAYDDLTFQVEVVITELARRIGQTFTLDELATAYSGADRWAIEAIHDAMPDEPPRNVSTAADAAFDRYSRRASDYRP